MNRISLALTTASLLAGASATAQTVPASFPVTIIVDAGRQAGELKPIWRFFGADEPNYATMKDGRKLMSHLGELRPGDVFFRAHNLLSSGDGTPAFKWGSTNAYTETKDGKPVYDWTMTDRIIERTLERPRQENRSGNLRHARQQVGPGRRPPARSGVRPTPCR